MFFLDVTVFFLLSRLSKTADSVDSPNEDSLKIEIHPKKEKRDLSSEAWGTGKFSYANIKN
jgi:hypothetical protein